MPGSGTGVKRLVDDSQVAVPSQAAMVTPSMTRMLDCGSNSASTRRIAPSLPIPNGVRKQLSSSSMSQSAVFRKARVRRSDGKEWSRPRPKLSPLFLWPCQPFLSLSLSLSLSSWSSPSCGLTSPRIYLVEKEEILQAARGADGAR